MVKIKSTFFCQNCGAQSSKWIGKCQSCNEWNTYIEELIQKNDPTKTIIIGDSIKRSVPNKISEIQSKNNHRFIFSDKEFNRVLGSGLTPGSVVLIGGEPGIGKSTLLLNLALKSNFKILLLC